MTATILSSLFAWACGGLIWYFFLPHASTPELVLLGAGVFVIWWICLEAYHRARSN